MEITYKTGTQNWQQLNIDIIKKLKIYTGKKLKNNYINCIWNVQNTIKCKIYCAFVGYML